jgi:hypothetical protein
MTPAAGSMAERGVVKRKSAKENNKMIGFIIAPPGMNLRTYRLLTNAH